MIITVSGDASGSGKTTLIRIILRVFPDRFDVIKITPGSHFGEGIEERADFLYIKGKDTFYYLSDGAKKVYWVRGSHEKLSVYIDEIFSKNKGDIIVEGNYFLNLGKPDLLFFVESGIAKFPKENAEFIKNMADYVIINKDHPYVKDRNNVTVNLKDELKVVGLFSRDLKKMIPDSRGL